MEILRFSSCCPPQMHHCTKNAAEVHDKVWHSKHNGTTGKATNVAVQWQNIFQIKFVGCNLCHSYTLFDLNELTESRMGKEKNREKNMSKQWIFNFTAKNGKNKKGNHWLISNILHIACVIFYLFTVFFFLIFYNTNRYILFPKTKIN